MPRARTFHFSSPREICTFLVIVAFVIFAAVAFIKGPGPSTVYEHFSTQFFVCLVVFTIFSALLAFTEHLVFRIILLPLQFAIVVVISIPLGNNLQVTYLLGSSLILEYQIYVRQLFGLSISLLTVLVLTLLQGSYEVWDINIPAPRHSDLLALAFMLIATTAAAFFVETLSTRTSDYKRTIEELNQTIERLAVANQAFQEYAISAKELAEVAERKRISREIHDSIGFTLTNLIVMMESAIDFSRTDQQKTEELLDKARTIAEKGLEDIRYSLRLLRSVGASKVRGIGAIHKMSDTFAQNTGISIKVEYGNIPASLGQDVDLGLYSIVQESIINSFRHGHANKIRILFWLADTEIRLVVSDNGTGSSNFESGIGLAGMKERVAALGGEFRPKSTNQGFEIYVAIPVGEREPSQDD